jgi:hypothetical protein
LLDCSYWQAGKWELLPDGQVMQCYPLSGEVYLQVTNLNSGYQVMNFDMVGVFLPLKVVKSAKVMNRHAGARSC